MISAVARLRPALALQCVDANWAKVSSLLDASARGDFAPRLVSGSNDPGLIAALRRFGDAHLTAGARGDFAKAEARITDNADTRAKRLPDVDLWLTAHERRRPAGPISDTLAVGDGLKWGLRRRRRPPYREPSTVTFAGRRSGKFDHHPLGDREVRPGDLKPYGDGRARRFAWRPKLGPAVRHLKELDLI